LARHNANSTGIITASRIARADNGLDFAE